MGGFPGLARRARASSAPRPSCSRRSSPRSRRRSPSTRPDGIDVSAFTSYIDSGNTVLYPITDKAPQINLIVQPTLEEFLNGNEDAAKVFKDMNAQVNNQLKFAAK